MPQNQYNQFLDPIVAQYQAGTMTQGDATRQIGRYADQQGIGANELSGYLGLSPEQTRNAFSQMNVSLAPDPLTEQYGLSGAENALNQGAMQSQRMLGQTMGQVNSTFNKGISGLQPFVEPGQQANSLQAALSGALGPEAQAQAFRDFQASPGQSFLQEQGERALTRNAAATGGLGGGNVRRELVGFGQGLAQQDLQNQFGRLGDVATRGLSAGTTIGGLRGQQAGIQGNIGAQGASFAQNTANQIANLRSNAGANMSANIGNTTSSLANLINQQGAGTADMLGAGYQNINQLIQMAQQGDASAMEQLGTTLANLGMQGSSQYSSQPIIPGAQTNYLGQLGQVASGVGGMMTAYGGMNQPSNTFNNLGPQQQRYATQNFANPYGIQANNIPPNSMQA